MTILKKVFKEMLFGGRKKDAEYEKWKVQIKDSSIISRNPEHFKELCEDAAIAKETGKFIRIIILPISLCILAGVISYFQDNSENFETFFTKVGIACIIFEVILLLFLFKELDYEKWEVKELCEDAAIAKETGGVIRIIILPIFLCILAGVISYFQDNSENFETFFTKVGIACIIFEVILLLFLFKELDRERGLELLKELYINGIKENKHCPNTENVSIIIEEHTELRGKKEKSKKKHKKNKRK